MLFYNFYSRLTHGIKNILSASTFPIVLGYIVFLWKQRLQSQTDNLEVQLCKSLCFFGCDFFLSASSSKWPMSPKQQICQVQLLYVSNTHEFGILMSSKHVGQDDTIPGKHFFNV